MMCLVRISTGIILSFFIGLFCIGAASPASAQTGVDTNSKSSQDQRKTSPAEGSAESTQTTANADTPAIYVYLVGGGRLEADELGETADGIWYKQSGVTTLLDRKRVARIERPSENPNGPTLQAGLDSMNWSIADSAKVEKFFLSKFGRPLPTTAFGQSDLHDRWGLDHRNGLDVGLHPDSTEGLVLVEFLRREKIPFLVFRGAVPGVATGPHIHIGKASHRVRTSPQDPVSRVPGAK
jgi:hypothetical protein